MELINASDTPSVEEKDKPQNGKNSYKLRYPQRIYLQHVQQLDGTISKNKQSNKK